MMKKNGFTLIELLIAISIIALLSAIGFVVYGTVLKQGRDTKRQSDLRAIQSAIEQYNSDKGYSPANLTDLAPVSGKKYIKEIPTDPNLPPYPQYCYLASSGYMLYAQLENQPAGPYTCNSISYNLKVTPP